MVAPRPGRAGPLRGSLADYKLLLQAIASAGSSTRPILTASSGLTRSTVSQRVQDLIDAGIVREVGESRSTGGRRPTRLSIDGDTGVIVAIDAGATHGHIRISGFSGAPLVDEDLPLSIASDPGEVMSFLCDRVEELLARIGVTVDGVRACAIGVPGPVNFAEGTPINPPLMPGWDGVGLVELVQKRLPAPVVVDNDVNIMALGDYEARWRGLGWNDLLFVKHGTGIGCGIIAHGAVHRGHDGAAGDIGHVAVHLPGAEPVACVCGNLNCLEAVAGGQALVARLTDLGYELSVASEIPTLVGRGDATAMNLIRDAGRLIAEVLTSIVNFYNPAAIVIGGSLGSVEQTVLAGMREVIYGRSTALATRRLQIVPSHLGRDAGVHGATLLAMDRALDDVLWHAFDERPGVERPATGGSLSAPGGAHSSSRLAKAASKADDGGSNANRRR